MTDAADAIKDGIQKMGYITIEPRDRLKPSYYRLKDGTLLRVMINITHVMPDSRSEYGYSMISNNVITAYVQKENRRPDLHDPLDPSSVLSNILDEDMQPETLLEDFNVYSMSNGVALGVKAVVAQVVKTKLYTATGEPLYLAKTIPVIKVMQSS